ENKSCGMKSLLKLIMLKLLAKLRKISELDVVRKELEYNVMIKITNVIYFTKNDMLIELNDEYKYTLNDILNESKPAKLVRAGKLASAD
ncbi:14299_t:CDS:1, partial [Dentiscutata erythropus]